MPDLPATRRLVERGRAGRARLPGKHGAARVDFSTVQVVIADRPGELARLLVACGQAGVNVEDVAIEHSPGHPVGLVELAVRPDSVAALGRCPRRRRMVGPHLTGGPGRAPVREASGDLGASTLTAVGW